MLIPAEQRFLNLKNKLELFADANLCACGALVKVDGAPEYEEAIRKYFDHPNEQVRWWAEHALGVEGPTTAKRNAEYRKKHANE